MHSFEVTWNPPAPHTKLLAMSFEMISLTIKLILFVPISQITTRVYRLDGSLPETHWIQVLKENSAHSLKSEKN